jgi:hypothetical protein
MNLDNYVDVPTRLKLALEKWPDLRVQETGRELTDFGGRLTLICTVTVWRSPDDTHPSIASAAENVPGLTPYTKNSELMVGFTSALGRALGYMGVGINSSIASRNEVEARRTDDKPAGLPEPRVKELGSKVPAGPSQAQLQYLSKLNYTGPTPRNRQDASRLIESLTKAQKMLDDAKESEEDAF